jgi:hypothetical protein
MPEEEIELESNKPEGAAERKSFMRWRGRPQIYSHLPSNFCTISDLNIGVLPARVGLINDQSFRPSRGEPAFLICKGIGLLVPCFSASQNTRECLLIITEQRKKMMGRDGCFADLVGTGGCRFQRMGWDEMRSE